MPPHSAAGVSGQGAAALLFRTKQNPRKPASQANFRGFFFGATDLIRTGDLLITSQKSPFFRNFSFHSISCFSLLIRLFFNFVPFRHFTSFVTFLHRCCGLCCGHFKQGGRCIFMLSSAPVPAGHPARSDQHGGCFPRWRGRTSAAWCCCRSAQGGQPR